MKNTIKAHQEALIKNYSERIEQHTTIFALKQTMVDENICPRCGTGFSSWGPCGQRCFVCGLQLTDWEEGEILDGKKGILRRVLKKKRK